MSEQIASAYQAKFRDFGLSLTHIPAQPTIQPPDNPIEERSQVKFWRLTDKDNNEIVGLDVFESPNEDRKGFAKIGYLSWPAQISREQIGELQQVMQKYSMCTNDKAYWYPEDEDTFCFDYAGRTIWIETPNGGNNPGITIDFLEETKPDDLMMQELFNLTAVPNMNEGQRKKLATTITSFASEAIKEPFEIIAPV